MISLINWEDIRKESIILITFIYHKGIQVTLEGVNISGVKVENMSVTVQVI